MTFEGDKRIDTRSGFRHAASTRSRLRTLRPFIVTTTLDNVPGSLRQGIAGTPAGGSIECNIPTSDRGCNVNTDILTITSALASF